MVVGSAGLTIVEMRIDAVKDLMSVCEGKTGRDVSFRSVLVDDRYTLDA